MIEMEDETRLASSQKGEERRKDEKNGVDKASEEKKCKEIKKEKVKTKIKTSNVVSSINFYETFFILSENGEVTKQLVPINIFDRASINRK